ncbi:MAG: competence/damage-inducible protein A [Acidimicrobiia bacterium]
MRADVLAIGTELLLGQITDTNSAWIGEHLADAGIDSYEHRHVGDNQARIVDAIADMLTRADALIICGGLGPTHDDLTRDAIAQWMGVQLVRRNELVAHIETIFQSRGRAMPDNNLRQADVPAGAHPIANPFGTAPGILAEHNGKVVYAVPGVPAEMQLMMTETVIPDLMERAGERAVIRSRNIKVWGQSESGLAEMITTRVDAQTNPTIAFLARGIEGIWVRVTARAATELDAIALLDNEERELRAIIGDDLIFGVDDETMESTLLRELGARGLTLAVAESLTGGLVAGRIVNVPGASAVFKGGVVAYDTAVKREVLDVTAEKVISEQCAGELAEGVRRLLGADVGLGVTGVAGPDEQEGQPVGTVCMGVAIKGQPTTTVRMRLPGHRETVRQLAVISLLDFARKQLP